MFKKFKDKLMSVTGNMNKITVNGQSISVRGNNIKVINDKVFVDGVLVKQFNQNEMGFAVHIKFEGALANLDCTTCEITGGVNGKVDATTCTINGNVLGDVDCTSLKCQKIEGNVDATSVKYL